MSRMVLSIRTASITLGATVLIMLVPSLARAQGFGVRTGVNVNPDQIAAGALYEWPMTEHVWFQPNADFGIGDNAKLVTMNMDLVYRMASGPRSNWTLFVGGGSALNYYKLTGYDVTLGGVNALGGVMHRSGFFAQAAAGFIDSPRFKFGVGYAFHPKTQRGRPVPRR
jgi:hypothetical protein